MRLKELIVILKGYLKEKNIKIKWKKKLYECNNF